MYRCSCLRSLHGGDSDCTSFILAFIDEVLQCVPAVCVAAFTSVIGGAYRAKCNFQCGLKSFDLGLLRGYWHSLGISSAIALIALSRGPFCNPSRNCSVTLALFAVRLRLSLLW